MAELRETTVERDAEGHVINMTERIVERPKRRRRGAGFGWGLLAGVILIAGAIIAFAYNLGSFQSAGREADQATAHMEQQLNEAQNEATARQEAANNTNSDTGSN